MALKAVQGLSNSRVIFDCRGIRGHEFLYERRVTLDAAPLVIRKTALKYLEEERAAAVQSNVILCVSHAMVDYMVREHGVSREKCFVVPCCVDTDRFTSTESQREKIRERLGLTGHYVVCYCGSLASYQMPRQSLELFQEILKLFQHAHFLGVTTQPKELLKIAADVGVPARNVTILSVPHEDVPAYLSAADVGLLLREPSVVNEVASPVKFGEYLASGLPVISSRGIGDCSDLIAKEDVGYVIGDSPRWDSDASALKTFIMGELSNPTERKVRARAIAVKYLSFQAYAPRLSLLLRSLLQRASPSV